MLKKIIVIILVFILSCGVLPVSANISNEYLPYDIKLLVDNQQVKTDVGYLTQHSNMLAPAQAVVEMMGASINWVPDEWKIQIEKEDRKLTMYIANYQCANGINVERMPAQPTLVRGTVMIPLRYVAEALGAVVLWDGRTSSVIVSTTGDIQMPEVTEPETPKPETPRPDSIDESLKKKVIVLDPGHGGNDPGAVAGKVKEKDLNLQVSMILKDLISDSGMIVHMTRTDDRYIGLYERAAFANKLKADLFVSIHHNASPDSSAQGVMTLYYPSSKRNGMTGIKLAQIVQKNMVNDFKTRDWGIIPRPKLVVTRETSMPAVIAELGFMSNKEELNRIVTYEFQKKAAESLYKSIIEALQH